MGRPKKEKKEEAVEENKVVEEENSKEEIGETKQEVVEDTNKKVQEILKNAKEKGKITYGELASQLSDINPEQIDKEKRCPTKDEEGYGQLEPTGNPLKKNKGNINRYDES